MKDYRAREVIQIFVVGLVMIIVCVVMLALALRASAQTRYELKTTKEMLWLSDSILKTQLYVRELKPNRSPQIDVYNVTVGNKLGSAYCAAGQYYCFWKASKLLGDQIPINKTGRANGIFDFVSKKGKKTAYIAQIHDLLIWVLPNKVNGHVERIIELGSKGWVTTIGFNTSAGKGSVNEGSGCFKRKRHLFNPIGKLRIRGLVGFNVR